MSQHQKFIQDYSSWPNVIFIWSCTIWNRFCRLVPVRSHKVWCLIFRFFITKFWDPKIAYFNNRLFIRILVDKNIGRFQISVPNIFTVQDVKSNQDHSKVSHGWFFTIFRYMRVLTFNFYQIFKISSFSKLCNNT